MNDRHFGHKPEYRIRLTDLFYCMAFPGEIAGCTIGFTGCKNLEERAYQKMANRKGVFIGAYVPNHLKESLRRRAAAEHRTLSQEITRILEEAVHGRGLPPGSIDRRTKETQPRRRSSDPAPRRRANDIPYTGGNRSGEDKS